MVHKVLTSSKVIKQIELEKLLTIGSVILSQSVNVPVKLKCSRGRGSAELNFDMATLRKYGIKGASALVGKTLCVTLKTREIPDSLKSEEYDSFSVSYGDELGSEGVQLEEIKRTERKGFCNIIATDVTYFARFESKGGGDGIHPHVLPCPFYRLDLALREEEYIELRDLAEPLIMKIDFKVEKY